MNEQDEEEQDTALHIGVDQGNVVVCLEAACGDHYKTLSARGAREFANGLHRLADQADRQLPELSPKRPPYLLMAALFVVGFFVITRR